MLLGFLNRFENDRFLPLGHFSLIESDAACLLLPLLDRGWIADHVDLALELRKAHAPAVPLLVEFSQRHLISVVVRWAEQSATVPVACDRVVVAFRGFALSRLDNVVAIHVRAECATLHRCEVERYRSVADLVER